MNILGFVTWDVSPVLLDAGIFKIQWYGFLFACTFIFGYLILNRMFQYEKVPSSYLDKLAIYVFIGVLVGARLGHCLFYEPSYYLSHPVEMVLPIMKTEQGWKFIGYRGLASHGGAIGILLMIALYSQKTKLNYLWTLDRLVIIVALAGVFIRTGNLMNSEIYGMETSMPWGFIFVRDGQSVPKHPTQIYEALCYLLIAIGLFWYYRHKKAKIIPGIMLGMFLTVLFLARFFIEFLKENQEAWEASMVLNMGQVLSLPFIIAGIVLIVLSLKGVLGKPQDLSKINLKDKI